MHKEAQRTRAQQLANAAIAKAAKATKRARKALEHQEHQRLQAARAAEITQRRQDNKRSEDTIAREPEVPRAHISSSIPKQFPHFPASQNIPYFFSTSQGFPSMTSSAHLSFS